jgi:hypothetical protein
MALYGGSIRRSAYTGGVSIGKSLDCHVKPWF